MRIKSVRLENFRSFKDATIPLNPYTCLVGPNGAGKSTVLAALNVFFGERGATAMAPSRLTEEDYYQKDTSAAIRITVTFNSLGEDALRALSAYVRQGELTVSVHADYNPDEKTTKVRQFGQRLGMEAFRQFFEADKAGAKVAELNPIYAALQATHEGLPAARSKDDKLEALRTYEAARPEQCTMIPSEDSFYGVNGTGILSRFVQWVYVPAVKDVGEESQEGRNTAFSKLVLRAVDARTQVDTALTALQSEAMERYSALLEASREGLSNVAKALQGRLASWAHPDAQLTMEWLSSPDKAVVLERPIASIKAGEGRFLGSMARMGNGLQRSYLLALLQELAGAEVMGAPTLILGCEEPELYQHPPQARHLANVLEALAVGNSQVIVTTHSPYFVNGRGFENIRLLRRESPDEDSRVASLTFAGLCDRVRSAGGGDRGQPSNGLVAKIHQALQPGVAEMFFARMPILVEGIEDVAYITAYLQGTNQWDTFRALGCHLVPTNAKDRMIQPVGIAVELGMPLYAVFDLDADVVKPEHRMRHESDNRTLLALLDIDSPPFPAEHIRTDQCTAWRTSISDVIVDDCGSALTPFKEAASDKYDYEGGLAKNGLYIGEWMALALSSGVRMPTLEQLCDTILRAARNPRIGTIRQQ